MTSTPSTSAGAPRCSASTEVPTSPSVEPSTEASTSVLREDGPEDPRQLGRAAVSAALPVASGTVAFAARRHHDDLSPRATRAPACRRRSRASARRGRSAHARRGSRVPAGCAATSVAAASIAAAAGAAVGPALRDPRGADGGRATVEEHVRRQTLGQRTGPALEREHRQHRRQQGRDEGRPVRGSITPPQPTISKVRGRCAAHTARRR